MPRFAPFAGLRYDPSRVEPAKVIAPPYDVVGPVERAALAARHSANAILVELPEPDPRSGGDRYAAAADRLADWRSDGDPGPRSGPRLLPLPHDRPRRLGDARRPRRARPRARQHRGGAPPRGDPGEGPERPARPAGGHPVQPLPHLGALARPGADRTARHRRPATGRRGGRRRGPPRAVAGRRPGGGRRRGVAGRLGPGGGGRRTPPAGHRRHLPGGRRGRHSRRRRDPGPGGGALPRGPDGGAHPPRPRRAARRTRPGGRLRLLVRRDPGRRLHRAHHDGARGVLGLRPGHARRAAGCSPPGTGHPRRPAPTCTRRWWRWCWPSCPTTS